MQLIRTCDMEHELGYDHGFFHDTATLRSDVVYLVPENILEIHDTEVLDETNYY